MAITRLEIEDFLQSAAHHPILDVRSPGEYAHAHIPGAYSFPLFTDDERKVVGTTYKQQSREAAIKIGLDLFGPKMRAMVETCENICAQHEGANHGSNKTVFVHCWRGGMRSAAIAWLLDLYGFKVYTLQGGYKKFRNYVLDTFKQPYLLRLVGGYTGSGKTRILHALADQHQRVIDLEAIARHRGSAFGNIGMPEQPRQEMFENLLALQLRKFGTTQPIWIEDESQRIGLVNIPNECWTLMRNSPIYFIDAPFDARLDEIVNEYGTLDTQRMIDAITRITKKLGHLQASQAINLLEEKNTRESFAILLKYYDKHYLKALHNRKDINSLLHRIECTSITSENANLLISIAESKQKA